MRTRSSLLLSLSVVTALAVAAPATAQRAPGQSPQEIKDQSKDATFQMECADSVDMNMDGEPHTLTSQYDDQLWPPNHKYQSFDIVATGGDGDESITLTTTVTHDEYVTDFMPMSETDSPEEEEQGAGNTQNDADPFFDMTMMQQGPVVHSHDIRSERSGRGDGRTYTVTVDAMFDMDTCSGEFFIEVPHDMRSSNAPAKQDKTGDDEG